MMTLVLVFCLSADPASCHEERPALEPMASMACLMAAQTMAAEWVGEHPKYRLERYRCEPAGRRDSAA